eukprot:5328254-Amphidinium_carterae.1
MQSRNLHRFEVLSQEPDAKCKAPWFPIACNTVQTYMITLQFPMLGKLIKNYSSNYRNKFLNDQFEMTLQHSPSIY